ncbi:hypothetical protein Syun_003295 [Stephania yunnanensis]|uniref:Uncharacterized protein n=1 Tax=Stephania yunnanensis TaxID=152371 RepID=A0AAP0L2G2_9MAGN
MKNEGFDQPPPTSHHHHQTLSIEIMVASKQQRQPLLEMMVGGSASGNGYIAEITLIIEGFCIEISNGGRDEERTRVRNIENSGKENDDFDDANGERAEDEVGDGGE